MWDLVGETKPMEGSSGRTLATAICHDGLVSGAKPLSRLLREVSTGPDAGPLRWVQAQCKGGSAASAAGPPDGNLRVPGRVLPSDHWRLSQSPTGA
jgi:hypothetical protein